MPNPKLSGPWDESTFETYLRETALPIRLSVVSSSGWPTIVSLWFVYDEGAIRCASKKSARIVKLLEKNTKCAFEVSGETPPYFGVRGQGKVTLDPKLGPKLLPKLIERYVGPEDSCFRRWLLAQSTEEVAIIINPIRVMSWDYRKRMSI